MFRSNIYTEGNFFTLQPLARQPVVPGQSVAIDVKVSMETRAFLQNLLHGGVMDLYAFYVPFRLVWDEWMDFISDPGWTGTFPTTATAWSDVFEKNNGPWSRLPRAAFKLIYNQYFGSEQFDVTSNTWFGEPLADAAYSLRRVRTTDQFAGKLMSENQAPDEVFEAPVAGAIASISLNEFRQAMNAARSDRRSNMTGDKYVDAMRRLGVDLNWTMQMAPEFLGKFSQEFEARETRSSYTGPEEENLTGRAYARFQTESSLRVGRKFFAEHGIIWVCGAVRPHIWNEDFTAPQDSFATVRDAFFLGDNQVGVSEYSNLDLGLSVAGNIYAPRFQYLRSGQNMSGTVSTTPWFLENGPTQLNELVYPIGVDIPSDDTLTQRMAYFVRYAGSGPSPVRANVL